MRIILLITAFILFAAKVQAADPNYLYRAKFAQADPGKLLELIALHKKRLPGYATAGDEPPFVIRHSQGDKWDLMFLFPIGGYGEYYKTERVAKRSQAEGQFATKFKELIAGQEELFVSGPALDRVT